MAAVVVPSRISSGGDSARPSSQVYAVRRVIALLLVVALAFVVAQTVTRSMASSTHVPSSGVATIHVVQPGESLWSIAQQERPHADMTQLVEALLRLNGGSTIHVGQELVLPS